MSVKSPFDQKIKQARQDLVTRFEFEHQSLVDGFKSNGVSEEEFSDRRIELRDKFIEQFVSSVVSRDDSNEPNYRVIFGDLLDNLYAQQQAASVVVSTLKERVKQFNAARALPPEQWARFDEKYFTRYVESLGLLYLLDQMIGIFELTPFRDAIITSELDRLQNRGKKQ